MGGGRGAKLSKLGGWGRGLEFKLEGQGLGGLELVIFFSKNPMKKR